MSEERRLAAKRGWWMERNLGTHIENEIIVGERFYETSCYKSRGIPQYSLKLAS
jgi:hypothetical protein